MSNDELEKIADEANIKGDNNLAIVLYTFIGARNVSLDGALAESIQNWARQRVREINSFKRNENN